MFTKRISKAATATALIAALTLPFVAAWSDPSALPAVEPVGVQGTDVVSILNVELPVAVSNLALETAAAVQAYAEPQDLYGVWVDGVPLAKDPFLTDIQGETYAALETLSYALLPESTFHWDGTTATVKLSGVLDLTATPGQSYVVANGRYLWLDHKVQFQEDKVLLPLNTLLKAMDASCETREDGVVAITSGSGGIVSGDVFYNTDDFYWLSHIIYAESGNQPLNGKIAVGNVVLNRVNSSRFPNSVYGVVFQRNQFSPAASGTIHRQPNAESILAAKLCLDGAVSLDGVLYFNQAGLRCWASRNRPFVATIAGHSFYA